jgi:hypothetical protein
MSAMLQVFCKAPLLRLVEGEQSGPPEPFDFDDFIRAKQVESR